MAASLPKKMKGVLVEDTGGPEVLQYRTDLPVPQVQEGQVLVKNEISGINFIDTYFRSGLYPAPKPEVLGREGGGTVVAVHASASKPHRLSVGQRVVWMQSAGYAEYSAVNTENVYPVPDSLTISKALASILQGFTALSLIEEAHKVEKGDWVLVTAAAGGTGGWLCQLLKLRGAHVIGTASTEEKRKLALSYGADVVVDYKHTLDAVKENTDGGVVASFDGVGKTTFDTSLEAIARKGSVVSYGSASGPVEPLKITRLTAKNAKVLRPTMMNYMVTQEEKDHYANALWEVLEKHPDFRVEVHKVYPLSEIKTAHQDLEGRRTSGKLLLDPSK